MRPLPFVLCLCLSVSLLGDDGGVEDLVNQALEAYRSGKKQQAAELLQKAASLIQKEGEQGLASFVPEAPEGWEREDIDSQSGTWGSGGQSFQWTQVSTRYKKGECEVRLTISSSPQLLQAQKAMVDALQNEQYRKMMNSDPDRKVDLFSRDGWSGMTQIEKGGDISRFAIGEKLMCQIEISSGDEATLEQFSGLIDWSGLGAAQR